MSARSVNGSVAGSVSGSVSGPLGRTVINKVNLNTPLVIQLNCMHARHRVKY